MNPDDFVCLCFHVTRRKVKSFIRVEKPKRPSQLSQCFGAGTGCGWCRPYLERLLEESLSQSLTANAQSDQPSPEPATKGPDMAEMTFEQYKKARSAYVSQGEGTPPPGAIPIDPPGESDSY